MPVIGLCYSDSGVLAHRLSAAIPARLGSAFSCRLFCPAERVAAPGMPAHTPAIPLFTPLSALPAERGAELFARCREQRVDVVVLAHLLRKVTIPKDFEERVINVHGSLLPAFGGRGYYGVRLQEVILRANPSRTGCTVHRCTQEYDVGDILLQFECEVTADDSPELLYARILRLEEEGLLGVLRTSS